MEYVGGQPYGASEPTWMVEWWRKGVAAGLNTKNIHIWVNPQTLALVNGYLDDFLEEDSLRIVERMLGPEQPTLINRVNINLPIDLSKRKDSPTCSPPSSFQLPADSEPSSR